MIYINIMNYEGKKKLVEIDDLDKIEEFTVYISSGDEIFSIETKYGDVYGYDAAKELNVPRLMNFNDGFYTLIKDGVVSEYFGDFLQRADTYEMFDYFEVD